MNEKTKIIGLFILNDSLLIQFKITSNDTFWQYRTKYKNKPDSQFLPWYYISKEIAKFIIEKAEPFNENKTSNN